MNDCWKMLPDEMVLEIMSFGDPNITLLYTNVMCQLLHHVTEFNYYRKNKPNNRWYNVTFDNYYKYVLRKNFIKKHVDKQYNNIKAKSVEQHLEGYNINLQYNNTIIDTIIDKIRWQEYV